MYANIMAQSCDLIAYGLYGLIHFSAQYCKTKQVEI